MDPADPNRGSGQGKPSKGRAAKCRIIVVAFAYELMGKEQERQNDIQKLLEEVLMWLQKVPQNSESERFKPAADLFSRAKLVLKKEREWISKNAIDGIQEKVDELERQLIGIPSKAVNERDDEDLNNNNNNG